ncbi:septum site-determining protein MinC [Nitrogeniibacter mangrovi]|uniref:Probable septum site-determining protein MinC n=1 Tax=Nitrogeniibacter mangrovi TaxID=2016596 RepID=A0A6C1B321_9RHOO|nr:septum site-determining protein MinC [Nitrogeniibacter mangrovi]QID17783.1 septum site-determining protein MinC [Nitrogeniibacter mangrovi]
MKDSAVSSRPIEFKGATLGVMTARLRDTDPMRLADAMHAMLGGMPDFFNLEAAILDFSALDAAPESVDWASLTSLLRRYRLQPVAVSHIPDAWIESARRIGLAVLDEEALRAPPSAPAEPVVAEAAPPAPAAVPAPAPAGKTLVVERPLRSGQQAYAQGGDLILLGGVSHGAEVIADGNIHCYGPLRGRAIAGAQGDADARILSTDFGPELIAIAGIFRTFEKGIPESVAGKCAQARLSSENNTQSLILAPLQTA